MKFIEAPQVVTINDTLNPLLWDNNDLIPEVRYKLLQIAKHFADTLKVKKLNLKDITISGSNASFNYSEYSDIDLHLVVVMKGNAELEDYFLAKKNNFNYVYDVKIFLSLIYALCKGAVKKSGGRDYLNGLIDCSYDLD